jgi:hypothetical protein
MSAKYRLWRDGEREPFLTFKSISEAGIYARDVLKLTVLAEQKTLRGSCCSISEELLVRTIFGGPDLNLAAKLLSPQKDSISTKRDLE